MISPDFAPLLCNGKVLDLSGEKVLVRFEKGGMKKVCMAFIQTGAGESGHGGIASYNLAESSLVVIYRLRAND